jgi:hypothetical protein
LFEAKGIQRWLMEGGKLRDIAAASDFLANVAASDENDLLAEILKASAFTLGEGGRSWSRRASGAFMLHYDRDADKAAFEKFRALWRLAFMRAAPGLEFVETFGYHETSDVLARKRAYEERKLGEDRPASGQQRRRSAGRENGFASALPLGHPFVQFAQRTGRPAAKQKSFSGEAQPQRYDLVTLAKQRAEGVFDRVPDGGVGKRFMPPLSVGTSTPYWPKEMDVRPEEEADRHHAKFPFETDARWIGVVHADISGLGTFYRAISDTAEKIGDKSGGLAFARKASEAIECALANAAQTAGEVLRKNIGTDTFLIKNADNVEKETNVEVMPARPIVLGGDDITIIVRGDLALDWVEKFLITLEDETERGLKKVAEEADQRGGFDGEEGEKLRKKIERRLTACAGVAFGKSKQPFFRLLELADGLCGFAKRAAKKDRKSDDAQPASLIAFHRVTESALAAEAADLFKAIEADGFFLSAQPYAVGAIPSNYPPLSALRDVKSDLANAEVLKRGPLRQLRRLMLEDGMRSEAEETWRRWWQMAEKREGGKTALLKFATHFEQAGGGKPAPKTLPFGEASRPSLHAGRKEFVRPSPLFDAIEWEAVS